MTKYDQIMNPTLYSITKLKNVKMLPELYLGALVFQEISLSFRDIPGFPLFQGNSGKFREIQGISLSFREIPGFLLYFSRFFSGFPSFFQSTVNPASAETSVKDLKICSKHLVLNLTKSHFPLDKYLFKFNKKDTSLLSCMYSQSTIKTLERRN